MTKKEAMMLVNESAIDRDEKFTREINALFNQKETVEILQNAYNDSDEDARTSLMDATEKQFLDKFAAMDDKEIEKDKKDDFLEDGSNLDDNDEEEEEDGSDEDSSEDNGSDDDFDMSGSDEDNDDSNPFASFGDDVKNPFESYRSKGRSLNESIRTPRFIRKRNNR